jgi:hypothetical protein
MISIYHLVGSHIIYLYYNKTLISNETNNEGYSKVTKLKLTFTYLYINCVLNLNNPRHFEIKSKVGSLSQKLYTGGHSLRQSMHHKVVAYFIRVIVEM